MKHYLKFLDLSLKIEFNCDTKCIELLELIALAENNGTPLTVTKAMNLESIASAATMHRKIDALREAGYIEQQFKEKNRRTKYLVITERTKIYFKALQKAMIHALEDKQ